MKANKVYPFEMLKEPQAWLGALAVGVMLINLAILWKVGDEGHLGMSVLFWLSVSSIVWEKRERLNLKSDSIGSFIGALLIGFFLFARLYAC